MKTEKLATLIPLEELDANTVQQIAELLDHDFVIKAAIMPDCHLGYDMPIGGVALTEGVISPAFVGYDIGCGMCYIDTKIPVQDLLPNLKRKEQIFEELYQVIPTGVGGDQGTMQDYQNFTSAALPQDKVAELNLKAGRQLGTLGSGNHFIEIGENQQGNISVTIHSGSRGFGYGIADWYMNQGRFLALDSELGTAYHQDMVFAQDFALANRKLMMKNILATIGLNDPEVQRIMKEIVNENHNHAIVEGSEVLHRKGATPAKAGQLGVIPGSMKAGVFLTRGLGNKDYLESASHGAGRKFSRNKARKSLEVEEFEVLMQGIVAKVDRKTLDEAPHAYKDLQQVIAAQEGKVIEVVDFIKPLINVKA